jgi:hypothetical protein
MEVFGILGRGEIDTKSKAIRTTVDFVEQFIGNDKISTGESVVGEGSVPDAKTGGIVGRAGRSLASEAFVVAFTFKDGTIAENDASANNTRIDVEVMLGSISPGEGGDIFSREDLVRVLVIIVSLFHGGRKCVVIEDVCGCDESRREGCSSGGSENGRSNCGWNSRCGRRFLERDGVNVVKIDSIEVRGKVQSIRMNEDGEGALLFKNSFVDSVGEFLLGAKTTRSAENISPGECHGIDKRVSTMLESSVGAGIEEKFFSGSAKKYNEIIREVGRFLLRKEDLGVNCVAGEAMKVFVGETNIKALDLFVLSVFHGVCCKRNV